MLLPRHKLKWDWLSSGLSSHRYGLYRSLGLIFYSQILTDPWGDGASLWCKWSPWPLNGSASSLCALDGGAHANMGGGRSLPLSLIPSHPPNCTLLYVRPPNTSAPPSTSLCSSTGSSSLTPFPLWGCNIYISVPWDSRKGTGLRLARSSGGWETEKDKWLPFPAQFPGLPASSPLGCKAWPRSTGRCAPAGPGEGAASERKENRERELRGL